MLTATWSAPHPNWRLGTRKFFRPVRVVLEFVIPRLDRGIQIFLDVLALTPIHDLQPKSLPTKGMNLDPAVKPRDDRRMAAGRLNFKYLIFEINPHRSRFFPLLPSSSLGAPSSGSSGFRCRRAGRRSWSFARREVPKLELGNQEKNTGMSWTSVEPV